VYARYLQHTILQTIKRKNFPDTVVLPPGAAVTLKTVLERSPE